MPLRLERDGPSVVAFLPLVLPSGREIETEVDMGCDVLILDESLAPELGVDLDGEGVRRVEGSDETGFSYRRFFARLDGVIHPAGAPDRSQARPEAMFQQIIYGGLVGDAFLRRFVVTYDLPGERLILGGRRVSPRRE